MKLTSILSVAIGAIALSATAVPAVADAGPRVVVHVGVPAPAPAPKIWIAGHWNFDRALKRRVWVEGTWRTPPRAGSRWVPAHYAGRGRSRHFVPGHWK